ncbi:hypothetical protein K0M31_007409 [Melipona bicolor]|uniref:Uncharacterized protein n=1 Tax=Melipona bicolor TaxID=60889 RepID=A0AA40KVM3_9HYME|nr:hypothetical protein K0M31_007409 [Melipona bicolor]
MFIRNETKSEKNLGAFADPLDGWIHPEPRLKFRSDKQRSNVTGIPPAGVIIQTATLTTACRQQNATALAVCNSSGETMLT